VARFLASIQGGRGEATRLGTVGSGISAHARGWDLGVRVDGRAIGERDAFAVAISGGSNDGRRSVDVLELEETDGGAVRVSVLVADGGRSVFYVDAAGGLSSREPVR
jgi:hypothetical protein